MGYIPKVPIQYLNQYYSKGVKWKETFVGLFSWCHFVSRGLRCSQCPILKVFSAVCLSTSSSLCAQEQSHAGSYLQRRETAAQRHSVQVYAFNFVTVWLRKRRYLLIFNNIFWNVMVCKFNLPLIINVVLFFWRVLLLALLKNEVVCPRYVFK